METITPHKTPASDPWRVLSLSVDGAPREGQEYQCAASLTGALSDSDCRAAEQGRPVFQPRFLPAPDGTEWS